MGCKRLTYNDFATTLNVVHGNFEFSPKTCADGYRYGFQGQEKDDEIKGEGNSYDFGARMYDSRLGRWLTIDPLAGKYPNLSSYNFVANSPIIFVDPDGKIIIDSDGNEVNVKISYNKEYDSYSATFEFAKGTSGKVKRDFKKNGGRIISAMIQVENARNLVQMAIESKDKIHYNLTDEDNVTLERTTQKDGKTNVKLNGEMGSAVPYTLSVYNPNGVIVKNVFERFEVNVHLGSIRTMKEYDGKNLTIDERIAITGSHETYHATADAEYIKEDNDEMPRDSERHKGAYDAGEKTENEILDKKKK